MCLPLCVRLEVVNTGFVGGGTLYLNISVADECNSSLWTEPPRSDVVQAITTEPSVKVEHSRTRMLRVLLQVFSDIFLLLLLPEV